MMAMMVSLHRRLETGSDTNRDQQFFKHALRSLITSSGRQVEMEDWMITSYDVEFGHEIGSGGLYVFPDADARYNFSISIISSGQVFKGNWNKMNVALKVLMLEDGVIPTSSVLHDQFTSSR